MSKKEIRFTKKPGTPPPAAEAWVNSSRGTDAAAASDEPVKPEEPTKRLTLDIPESLHARVKSQCAKRGSKMVDEIRLLLETNFPVES
jgi:hypothetical protein